MFLAFKHDRTEEILQEHRLKDILCVGVIFQIQHAEPLHGVRVGLHGAGDLWFSSSDFLENNYNAYSSGANGDLAMNAVASLIGETDSMAIRSKSLNYNYLSITESAASTLKVLMIGVFPLAYLGLGIYLVVRRRRLQHEAV